MAICCIAPLLCNNVQVNWSQTCKKTIIHDRTWYFSWLWGYQRNDRNKTGKHSPGEKENNTFEEAATGSSAYTIGTSDTVHIQWRPIGHGRWYKWFHPSGPSAGPSAGPHQGGKLPLPSHSRDNSNNLESYRLHERICSSGIIIIRRASFPWKPSSSNVSEVPPGKLWTMALPRLHNTYIAMPQMYAAFPQRECAASYWKVDG